MIRTVISLSEEDKRWLDQKARTERVPMAEIVRAAVRRYRDTAEQQAPALAEVLQQTRGIWSKGDGLAWQQKIREEWGT